MNLVSFLQTAIVLDKALQKNYPNKHSIFSSIERAIDQAWKAWDDAVLSTYYVGEKPKEAPRDFELQWIANEDFEADGYDVDDMCAVFGIDRY